MRKHLIILVCLIAFVPRIEWEKNPEAFIEALKETWAKKHPGQKNPTVKIGENKLGQIVIEIDQPKQEI